MPKIKSMVGFAKICRNTLYPYFDRDLKALLQKLSEQNMGSYLQHHLANLLRHLTNQEAQHMTVLNLTNMLKTGDTSAMQEWLRLRNSRLPELPVEELIPMIENCKASLLKLLEVESGEQANTLNLIAAEKKPLLQELLGFFWLGFF
eukprot:GHVO01056584.1.p3 GENE.GHVO01056584.1~~GHVO01056584.1.p3  ORF type:complete len:147 (+),score=17.28 GHVO01056584.1:561-1001(+)